MMRRHPCGLFAIKANDQFPGFLLHSASVFHKADAYVTDNQSGACRYLLSTRHLLHGDGDRNQLSRLVLYLYRTLLILDHRSPLSKTLRGLASLPQTKEGDALLLQTTLNEK